jgi:hypothetical protein
MAARKAGVIFFFLVLFPYITPFDTVFDTQPWALFFACGYLLWDVVRQSVLVPRWLLPLMLFALCSILCFFTSLSLRIADPIEGLRALSGYISVAAIPYVAYHTLGSVKARHFSVAIGVWLIVGLLQTVGDWSFASQLLARFAGAIKPPNRFGHIVCV